MIAGDFETVRGAWGVRGEAAYLPNDTLQSAPVFAGLPGRTFDGGVGVDRQAGNVRVSGTLNVSRRRVNRGALGGAQVAANSAAEFTDTLLVGSAERSFARETRVLRVLAAWSPDAESAFVRGIGSVSLRDNVWLELSGGWLHGDGVDMLSRLSMRDFAYARIKVHF